jgi:predicted fused transcriptional regulator/phosphomethylpyrimidine kinase
MKKKFNKPEKFAKYESNFNTVTSIIKTNKNTNSYLNLLWREHTTESAKKASANNSSEKYLIEGRNKNYADRKKIAQALGCEFATKKFIARFHKNIDKSNRYYKKAWNNVKGRKDLLSALKDGVYGSVLERLT